MDWDFESAYYTQTSKFRGAFLIMGNVLNEKKIYGIVSSSIKVKVL